MQSLQDLLRSLNTEDNGKDQHLIGGNDIEYNLMDKNKDDEHITNHFELNPTSIIANVRANDISFILPAEILLNILQDLTVIQLLPCQWVSRQFRTAARTVLIDKLGGNYLRQRYLHPLYQESQTQTMLRNDAVGSPPLPHPHQSSSPQFSNQYDQQGQQQHQENVESLSQTGLQIQYQSPSISAQSSSPPSPRQQSYHCDAGYVAPGNIALFLFPCHDHTPTGWQERQTVHFQCTGIDRTNEQLIFEPISPDTNDCLKFNINSWNLPTASPILSHAGTGAMSSSSNSSITSPVEASTMSSYKSPATGLDLFDYSTGQPRSNNAVSKPMSIDDGLGSYSFTDLFNYRRRSGGSGGSTSEDYSVIGIKYGDWPEERQTTGRWWGGGLQSSMTQQSMVFLPWAASPGGQGSTVDFQQRQIRKLHKEDCDDTDRDSDDEVGYSRVHRHHMYLSSGQARKSHKQHHRYFCLHHDKLITDISALKVENGSKKSDSKRKSSMETAGSEDLSVNYEAMVVESKRCQFCLSSSCKANFEIQVKFDQVRVSLDWILSGFALENKGAYSPSLPATTAATMQSVSQRELGQVPAS
ncbi:hypothetical protein BGX27_008761 [Mortierella sp. AM989]|nr:hypothetical protein BGX27_008761 [Mortierella sp. AM989]